MALDSDSSASEFWREGGGGTGVLDIHCRTTCSSGSMSSSRNIVSSSSACSSLSLNFLLGMTLSATGLR